jgi:hypothetical protein
MSSLFSEVQNGIGKIKYQEYIIKLLSEEVSVYVPYSLKNEFYSDITEVKPNTKKEILSVLKKYDGRI